MNFKELLAAGDDQDIALYYLACSLGLLDHDSSFDAFREHKHLFWTNNEIGTMLREMLGLMEQRGLLLFDDETGRYHWNAQFDLSRF